MTADLGLVFSVKILLILAFSVLLIIPISAMAQEYTVKTDNKTITIVVKPNNTIIIPSQNNTKLEQILQKLADKEEPQWKQGDLLISSATIIAFFGFWVLLTGRFTTNRKRELVDLLNGIVISSFGIQLTYLGLILIIVSNVYHVILMIGVIISTIFFLSSIVKNTRELFYLEYLASEKNTELDKIRKRLKERLKQVEEKVNEVSDDTKSKIS